MTKFFALIAALRSVRPDGLGHDGPSRANRRLIGAATMTKLTALIAACAVFAPMAMATLAQAAQIVA